MACYTNPNVDRFASFLSTQFSDLQASILEQLARHCDQCNEDDRGLRFSYQVVDVGCDKLAGNGIFHCPAQLGILDKGGMTLPPPQPLHDSKALRLDMQRADTRANEEPERVWTTLLELERQQDEKDASLDTPNKPPPALQVERGRSDDSLDTPDEPLPARKAESKRRPSVISKVSFDDTIIDSEQKSEDFAQSSESDMENQESHMQNKDSYTRGKASRNPSRLTFADLQFPSGETLGSDVHKLGEAGLASMTGDWMKIGTTAVLKRESVAYAGGLPNNSLGVLRAVIATAANGKAKRLATTTDTRSCWERWRSYLGEWFLAFVIIANTVSLGLQTEIGRDSSYWIVVDFGFTLVFFTEMVLKMMMLGLKQYFLGEYFVGCHLFALDSDLRWRLFEFLLVVTAILELVFVGILDSASTATGPPSSAKLAFFRILRLTRLARMIRVCRLHIFSDLMMMINGASGGMRTLMWSMILIALPLYGVAIFFRETLGDETEAGAESFSSLFLAWFTMFRCLVAGECVDIEGKPIIVMIAEHHGWVYGAVYFCAKVMMSFGLFNVITALYVENIVAAAKYNNVHQKRQRLLDAQVFADKMKELVEFVWRVHKSQYGGHGRGSTASDRVSSLSKMDIDDILHSIHITPEFFNHLRSFKDFQELLSDLDISDEDQLDLFDTLDVDGSGAVDLEEMVVGICKLRGDARRSDIVGVGLIVRNIQSELGDFQESIINLLNDQTNLIIAAAQKEDTSKASSRLRRSMSRSFNKSISRTIPSSLQMLQADADAAADVTHQTSTMSRSRRQLQSVVNLCNSLRDHPGLESSSTSAATTRAVLH